MDLGFKMYDADNHFYETTDAFTRHLSQARRRSVYWSTNERGHRHLVVGGRVWDYIPNPTFDPVAVPGALDRRKVEPLSTRPEYQNRDARLACFDRQNIEASLLFPTLASGLEEVVGPDIPLLVDLLWSFNRWMGEHWGFAHANRLFSTPLLSLADPAEAVEMLEWVLSFGARAIMVSSAPVRTAEGYRSPASDIFDPFWARCAEAGTLVCAHTSANGYNRYSGDYTGHYTTRPFEDHTLDRLLNHGRAISDFCAAMVWQGAPARHPGLRIVSVENRSDWVIPLVQRLKHYRKLTSSLSFDPVEVFERSVLVTPHWEDAIDQLVSHMPLEHVVAGSDYPHYDALAVPTEFASYLKGFDGDAVRRIMRDNLRSVLAAA